MDTGIGLPNSVRGVDRRGIVDWAQRAEAAGFSSLGTIDRLAYPSYESLTALAAAAAVTERIALLTDILIAPLRTNTALLAKQAATIDHLSGGRLTLGLAVGGREDDFTIGGTDFSGRGRAFDEQLATLTQLWREEAVGARVDGRERPGLLIGGSNARSFARAAEHADGWTMGGGTPDMLVEGIARTREAFRAAGRTDEPRIVALCYFALGDDAAQSRPRRAGRLLRVARGHRRADHRGRGHRRRDRPRVPRCVRGRGRGRADLLPVLGGPGAGRPARRGARLAAGVAQAGTALRTRTRTSRCWLRNSERT